MANLPTSCVEIYSLSEFVYGILVVKARQKRSFLFMLHKMTGAIEFSGSNGVSIFPDLEAGQQYLKQTFGGACKLLQSGVGLIGMAHFGFKVDIIVVTEAIPVAYFFNRHTIFQIKSVKHVWFDVPLFPVDNVELEKRRAAKIEMFPITDFHMWCETKDISVPTGFSVEKKDFTWNENLALPFEGVGQRDACLKVFQGTAVSQILRIESKPVRFTLITVRSSAHSGTRYIARGLNSDAAPANEVQCELIIERSNGHTMCHFWRRGTVPVQWRTVKSKALPTASLEVDENCDAMTPIYFARLRSEYDDPMNITIMNLLHNNESNAEYKLCQAYKHALADEHDIHYIEFDWHEQKKTLGLEACVEKYWSLITESMRCPSFTECCIQNQIEELTSPVDGTLCFPNDSTLSQQEMAMTEQQRSFIRVNCMDSLDRTNVGCFFYCAWVILFALRKSKAPHFSDITAMEDDLKAFLAQAFISIGDTVSFLYTNTPACMTTTFSQVGGIENKPMSDGAIAVQRRIQNFMKDQRRQKGIDTFLRTRFPRPVELYCVSSYPGHIMEPYPSHTTDVSLLNGIFGNVPTQLRLSCRGSSISIVLSLSQACYLHSIVMNLVPPNGPTWLHIEAGLLFDSLHPICSDLAIPRQTSVGPVVFRIPPDQANGSHILARIVRLEFGVIDQTLVLSNLFIFGTKKEPTEQFVLHRKTYESFPDIVVDKKWPRIQDTASMRTVIWSIQQLKFNDVMRIEIARLHHGNSKLEAVAQLIARGFDVNDFCLDKFGGKLTGTPVKSGQMCPNCHKDWIPWICSACGKPFCLKCETQYLVESRFFFDGSATLCHACLEQFKERNDLLLNLARFYQSYWRLHSPREYAFHQVISKYSGTDTDPTVFPNAFFAISNDPLANLVLTDTGGEISAPAVCQLCFGAPMDLESVTCEGSGDFRAVFHLTSNDTQWSVSPGLTKLTTRAALLTLSLESGTVNRIRFQGTPVAPVYGVTEIDRTQTYKFSDVITTKRNITSSDVSVSFRFGKPTVVAGISTERFTGVYSMIVFFYDVGSGEPPRAWEFVLLPIYSHDSLISFRAKHTTQFMKIVFYDYNSSEMQSARIGVF